MTQFGVKDRFIVGGLQLAMIINAFDSIDELFIENGNIEKGQTAFDVEREIIEEILTQKVKK